MAKTLDDLKSRRKQLAINPNTTGDSGHVATWMEQSAWTGEIIVQDFANDNATLWTLGQDNTTAVDFISRKTILELLAYSASTLISGETMAQAIAAKDGLGHVTVDSGITPEGKIIYTISKYDVASDSALTELRHDTEVSADTLFDQIVSATPKSSAKTLIVTPSLSGTNLEVNVDNATLSADTNGVISTMLYINSATPLSSTYVKAEYALFDGNGVEIPGSHRVIIPKDTSLCEVYSGHEDDVLHEDSGDSKGYYITSGTGRSALCFVYQLENGHFSLTKIDLSFFFSKEVFKDGFDVRVDAADSSHTIYVRMSEDCDKYLTLVPGTGKTSGLLLSGVEHDFIELRHDTEVSADTLNDKIEELSAATIESADTLFKMIKSGGVKSSAHTIVIVSADSGTNIEVNIDNKTIGKDASGVLSTLLEISSVTPTTQTVLKEYVLIDKLGNILGEHIQINKDKHLVSAYLGTMKDVIDSQTGVITTASTGDAALCLHFVIADGTHELVKINVEKFLEESEFKSGVTATNHIVHGVVANFNPSATTHYTDEFLYVNGDGFYTSGISEAISAISVTSSANTILVGKPTSAGTNLEVNIDNKTIGKDANGVLGTLLKISGVTASGNVKEEWALVDKYGNEISGSSHIKIYQNCEVSGLTMASAKTAQDKLGHVTVDSAMTSAGTVVYVIDTYDVASDSALTELSAWTEFHVGSGWSNSSITEVIVENEMICAKAHAALCAMTVELSAATIESADTLYKLIKQNGVKSSANTIVIASGLSGTNIEVNIDNKTIGKDANGVLGTLLKISGVTASGNVKEEWALVDKYGNEISGSSHIKIYQNCEVSGETISAATAAHDEHGHVVVASAETSGIVTYTVSAYDIASYSALSELSAWTVDYVGSGWVESSITEVIIANEEVVSLAIADIYSKLSAGSIASSANTILIQSASTGTNIEANIDFATISANTSGVLSTTLLIASATPSTGVKNEYVLKDANGNEYGEHIKIGQTCKVSGETMASAITAHDKVGHVTVDSAMTDGIVTYTIDKYDVASHSALTELSAWTVDYVGSGWTASSITEVIISNEKVTAKAIVDIYNKLSANTVVSSANTILIKQDTDGTNIEANIDNKTIGKDANGVLGTLLHIASARPTEAGVKSEYILVDGRESAITDSIHIKIGQSCTVSGETMASAKTAHDGYGHVTVDSADTSGVVTYVIDGYDIASYSALSELSAWTVDYVGSGWVESSITEVIIEDEETFAAALCDLDLRVSANTESIRKSQYYAGSNIDIDVNNVISLSGLCTINGSAITSGGNLEIIGEITESKSSNSSVTITSAATTSGKSYDFAVNVDDKTVKIESGEVAGQYAIKSAATPVSSAYCAEYALSVKDGSIAFAYSDNILIPAPLSAGSNINIDDNLKINVSGLSSVNGSAITSGGNIVLTISSITPSSTNVKEEFILADANGNAFGSHIKIYNDGNLHNAYLGHIDDTINEDTGVVTSGTGATALCLIYINDEKKYKLVKVDVSKFLEETEFADGLVVDNHVVKVKVDSTTGVDPYLSVSTNGVKLSGITNAIATAFTSGKTYVDSALTEYNKTANFASINGDASGLTTSANTFFAPTVVGDQNKPLLSNGSGAPVWASHKFVFCTQADYEASSKSSDTIYFIIS